MPKGIPKLVPPLLDALAGDALNMGGDALIRLSQPLGIHVVGATRHCVVDDIGEKGYQRLGDKVADFMQGDGIDVPIAHLVQSGPVVVERRRQIGESWRNLRKGCCSSAL